jgi:Cytidylate kinase-like family
MFVIRSSWVATITRQPGAASFRISCKDALDLDVVEVRGGLVGDEQRDMGEGARDRHPLAPAARQLPGPVTGPVRRPTVASRLNDWKTTPTVRQRYSVAAWPPSADTSRPRNEIEPEVGVSKPARHESSVVLPQPLGPRTTRSSPSSVLVTASEDTRRGRVADERQLPGKDAAREVDRSDAARADYLKRFYGARSELATHYDLVVNTDRLSPAEAVMLVTRAAGR